MNNDLSVKCDKCGNEVELSKAFKQQFEENITKQIKASAIKKANEKVELIKQKYEKNLVEQEKEIQEQTKKQVELAKKQTETLFKEQLENSKQQILQNSQDKEKLYKDLEELQKQKTKDQDELRKKDLEYQKKLVEEKDRLYKDAEKQAQEMASLKIKENDKKLELALKKNKELEQRLTQGSTQIQGEVLEEEIKKQLKENFNDNIEDVKVGAKGADLVQKVMMGIGEMAGTIVYECKNANWQKSWIKKLKEDNVRVNGDIAVLVTKHLPDNVSSFDYIDDVWVVSIKDFVPLVTTLRQQLINVYTIKQTGKSKDKKVELLYEYLTSSNFKNKMEQIIGNYKELYSEIEKERTFFTRKWARQEKSLSKIVENTGGLYAELQDSTGNKMLPIKDYEMEEM